MYHTQSQPREDEVGEHGRFATLLRDLEDVVVVEKGESGLLVPACTGNCTASTGCDCRCDTCEGATPGIMVMSGFGAVSPDNCDPGGA